MYFSSYGSRLDLQGWGSGVATSGYGYAFDPGDVRQRYTASFSGTSSASPIVAGSVLALQGALKGRGLRVATPEEIREALVATGTLQLGSEHIGPLPRLSEALTFLVNRISPAARWRTWEPFNGAMGTKPAGIPRDRNHPNRLLGTGSLWCARVVAITTVPDCRRWLASPVNRPRHQPVLRRTAS